MLVRLGHFLGGSEHSLLELLEDLLLFGTKFSKRQELELGTELTEQLNLPTIKLPP